MAPPTAEPERGFVCSAEKRNARRCSGLVFLPASRCDVPEVRQNQKLNKKNAMQLFDSHCHIDDHAFDRDRADVFARAARAGVKGIMIAGINLASAPKAIEIASHHNGCYVAVGVHPHDARHCDETVLNALKELARHPKVRAWGETGLDFNRMYSPRSDQEKWFARQLQISEELKLPVIFHERDSGGRFLEMLRAVPAAGRQGVVHCFSGNESDLKQYLDLELYIGITGILTLSERGADLRRLVSLIPDERLLVETDAPFLTPSPHKNKTRRNEPAFVEAVLHKLAQVRRQDPERLAARIWENTCRLYNLTD
jgi:TatD DNase family protein